MNAPSTSIEAHLLSDLTREEFEQTVLRYGRGMGHEAFTAEEDPDASAPGLLPPLPRSDLPPSPQNFDWRNYGVVTPVKHQGNCGSCWAFSALGALESASLLAGIPVLLSEQQLLDCSKENYACLGGLMRTAYSYIFTNGGVCASSSYPYTGDNNGTCAVCTRVARIRGFRRIANTEAALYDAIRQQPVAMGITGNSLVFQFYKTGIIDSESCGTNINHAVVAIGYGRKNDTDYWFVLFLPSLRFNLSF